MMAKKKVGKKKVNKKLADPQEPAAVEPALEITESEVSEEDNCKIILLEVNGNKYETKYQIGYDNEFYIYVRVFNNAEFVLDGGKWVISPQHTAISTERGEEFLAAWRKFLTEHPDKAAEAKKSAILYGIKNIERNIKGRKRSIDFIKNSCEKMTAALACERNEDMIKSYNSQLESDTNDLHYHYSELQKMEKTLRILTQEMDVLSDPILAQKRKQGAAKIKNKFPWLAKSKT